MASAPGSTAPRALGARVLRREDARLVRGGGRYVSDVAVPGLLEAAFVRSPRAHAVIEGIDADAARTAPGVVAVLLAEDLDGLALPMRAKNATPGYSECDTPVLARDKVRMTGEPVALVIADSRYRAEDAAALVDVRYRDLPPVLTIDDALAEGAPAVHDEVPDNRFNHFATATDGLDAAFESADEVVELEIRQQRYCAVPMEARVAIASYDVGTQELTAWLSSQVPHIARTGLAKHLVMPENRVRVIAPDMGGGFGAKCVLYQEDVAVCAASRLLHRPVKWVSDRSEDLHATMHGREQRHHIRVAATAEGRVLGVRSEISAANGAYAPWPYTAALDSGQASENVTGPYDIPDYGRDVAAVVTNKAPMGPYRGVGRVIACLGMERAMDDLAERLGLDALEVRRRNLVRSFPYTTAAGLVFESGDYVGMLDLLEETIDWKRVRAENEELRGQGVHRGLGVAFAVEQSAYGPLSLASRQMEMTFGYDTALDPGRAGRARARGRRAAQPRAGPRDDDRPDRGLRARHRPQRHRRHLGRYRDRALRPGHVGEPQHGDQRQRDVAGRARHQGQGPAPRRRRCSRPIPATSTSRTGACSCAARPRATCPSAPWRAGPRTSRICCPRTRSRGWRPRAATCRPTRARSPAPPTPPTSSSTPRPAPCASCATSWRRTAGRWSTR